MLLGERPLFLIQKQMKLCTFCNQMRKYVLFIADLVVLINNTFLHNQCPLKFHTKISGKTIFINSTLIKQLRNVLTVCCKICLCNSVLAQQTGKEAQKVEEDEEDLTWDDEPRTRLVNSRSYCYVTDDTPKEATKDATSEAKKEEEPKPQESEKPTTTANP